jgi:cell volume regulation protein A
MNADSAVNTVELIKHVLFIFMIILSAGALSSLAAKFLRIPDIVLFLVAGIVLGPEISGVINVPTASIMNQLILTFGACYILFDGGASLRFRILKEVWITVLIIATVGLTICAVLTGLVAQYALGIPLIIALLLGTVIASTDPATLIPVFRQVKIRDRVAQTVISESAVNDAVGAIGTFAVLGVAMGTQTFSAGDSALAIVRETIIGIAVGGVVGYLAILFSAHKRFGFLNEQLPVMTILLVIASYLGALYFHGSGFMGVFVAGLLLGNRESFGYKLDVHKEEQMGHFIETAALIVRVVIFVLLGSQVNFSLLFEYFWGAIAVVAAFMLVIRPITVFVCAGVDRRAKWSVREMLFMSWTRETGVIPAALAGMLQGMNAPGADVIAAVTFMAILLTILVQVSTTRWVAQKLGVLA